ncbi:hypothetical protein GINT2_000381 [Glugoides intestinalis]
MRNTLEKTAQIVQKFFLNFRNEIENDIELKNNMQAINNRIFDNKLLKGIYSGLQYSDYLIKSASKDYCSGIRKTNRLDKFLERSFSVPQYYGGVRDDVSNMKIGVPFEKYFRNETVNEYKVLQKIENIQIPAIIKNLFEFKSIDDDVSAEAIESFKRLKTHILNQEATWSNRKITLEDLRLVETESISIKNLKKTIKVNFEMSAILSGYSKKQSRNLRQNFSCAIEFVKENNKWIASSFSFTAL